jgi:ABC-2 type transport system ATP-binding protein
VNLFDDPVFPGLNDFEDIMYLPEEPHYHSYLSVEEAITFYASMYRRNISRAAVSTALEHVGLENYRRLRLAKCSKGMKQKVGIATCMLFEPKIMFLDEPTRGLDPVMVRKFRDYLLSLNQHGTTIIMNSHVLSEVEMICNRIAIMDKGKIIADDLLHNLVKIEGNTYQTVLETEQQMPEFVKQAKVVNGLTLGEVAESDLEQLMRHCAQNNIKLRSCRARVETLEDVFMRLVGE